MTATTSRTLVLLRHAKAERASGTPDVDRPLTDRGHADASAAGAWLATQGFLPDLVICSPTRRTRQTWHGVALALPAAPTVHYEKQAYAARPEDLLSLVRAVTDAVRTVLVISHNPGISLLSKLLDPDGEAGDSDGLRTCGLAVHRLAGAWSDCGAGRAPLIATHTARAAG